VSVVAVGVLGLAAWGVVSRATMVIGWLQCDSFIGVGVGVSGELPTAADAEFLIDVSEVGFHCLDGEVKLLGDLSVCSADL
jgi:hypothetical protein